MPEPPIMPSTAFVMLTPMLLQSRRPRMYRKLPLKCAGRPHPSGGAKPSVATTPEEQRGAASRAMFDLLPARWRLVAEHHRALRLKGEHAKQHAGGALRIVELDRAARLLRAQPTSQRILGSPDRLVIKRLGDLRKLVAVAEDHPLQRDDFAREQQFGADHQRLCQRRLDVTALAGAQLHHRDEP